MEDLVEGTPLNEVMVDTIPLTAQASDDQARATYAEWVLDVVAQIETAVAASHARGVVLGDLHLQNVLVGPDGRVTMIDFEVSGDVDDDRRQSLADPAFLAPPGRTGVELDRYALACLRLFLFLPLTALVAIDRRKADDLAAHIAAEFPMPRSFLDEAVAVIDGSRRRQGAPSPRTLPPLEASPESWPALRASMADAILASATPVEACFSRRPGTLVVVAHRISSAARARRVLLVDGGQATVGAHEELLAQVPLYRDMVGFWQPAPQ